GSKRGAPDYQRDCSGAKGWRVERIAGWLTRTQAWAVVGSCCPSPVLRLQSNCLVSFKLASRFGSVDRGDVAPGSLSCATHARLQIFPTNSLAACSSGSDVRSLVSRTF